MHAIRQGRTLVVVLALLTVVGAGTATAAVTDAESPLSLKDMRIGREVRVPATIPSDCSQDVSLELNAFLSAVPDGATVRFAANGCYRTERTIVIEGKSGWTVEGSGATLLRTEVSPQRLRYPEHNGHLRLVEVSDTVVRDLTVDGVNDGRDSGGSMLDARGNERSVGCPAPKLMDAGYVCYTVALEFEHGFSLQGVTDVTLENVTSKEVWGDGVHISGANQFTGSISTGVEVLDSVVDRNGRQGVSIAKSDGVVVDAVNIVRSRRAGIDLEPNRTDDRPTQNIEIRNSLIRSLHPAFASHGRGDVSHVFIQDNTIKQTGTPWITVRPSDGTKRTDWRVWDNTIEPGLSSPMPAMRFANTSAIDVRRNSMWLKDNLDRGMVGVGLSDGSEALIQCNWFRNAQGGVVAGDGTADWEAVANTSGDTPPDCLTDAQHDGSDGGAVTPPDLPVTPPLVACQVVRRLLDLMPWGATSGLLRGFACS